MKCDYRLPTTAVPRPIDRTSLALLESGHLRPLDREWVPVARAPIFALA